jgi:hypothetical protein
VIPVVQASCPLYDSRDPRNPRPVRAAVRAASAGERWWAGQGDALIARYHHLLRTASSEPGIPCVSRDDRYPVTARPRNFVIFAAAPRGSWVGFVHITFLRTDRRRRAAGRDPESVTKKPVRRLRGLGQVPVAAPVQGFQTPATGRPASRFMMAETKNLSPESLFLSRSTNILSRSSSFLSRSTQILSPPSNILSRSTQILSPSSNFMSRSTNILSRSTHFLSPSTHFLMTPSNILSRSTHFLLTPSNDLSRSTHFLSRSTHFLLTPSNDLSRSTHFLSRSSNFVSR